MDTFGRCSRLEAPLILSSARDQASLELASRHWTCDLRLLVLRGETGTGKTAVLRALAQRGEQVLDLECLANHRGSAFGGLGLRAQPRHDAFVVAIAEMCRSFDPRRPVYTEHEGLYLGAVGIPSWLVDLSYAADGIRLVASPEQRAARIAEQYGEIPTADIVAALRRLRRRLGAARSRDVRRQLQSGSLVESVELLLPYYDAAYHHQLDDVLGHTLATVNSERSAELVAADILALCVG